MPASYADRVYAASALPHSFAVHGVQASFQPEAGGPARPITVIRDDSGATLDKVTGGETETEDLWVTVYKDESNSLYGGIAAVARGDQLTFAGDPPDAAWGCTMQSRRDRVAFWDILFRRARPNRRGSAQ